MMLRHSWTMCFELVQWSLALVYILSAWLEGGREGGREDIFHSPGTFQRSLAAHLLQLPTVKMVVSESIKPSPEEGNNSLTGAGYDTTTVMLMVHLPPSLPPSPTC